MGGGGGRICHYYTYGKILQQIGHNNSMTEISIVELLSQFLLEKC